MKKLFSMILLANLIFWGAWTPARSAEPAEDTAPVVIYRDYGNFIKAYARAFVTQHDKFKKMTVLTTTDGYNRQHLDFLDANGNPGNIRLLVLCNIPDNVTPKNGVVINLCFQSLTGQPRWANCKSFIWLVDDKDFPWSGEVFNGSGGAVEGDRVEETHTVSLTVRQLDALCKAKKIEFQACNENFSFSPKHFWTLQYMDKKIHDLIDPKASE